jgi:hypothetical protein
MQQPYQYSSCLQSGGSVPARSVVKGPSITRQQSRLPRRKNAGSRQVVRPFDQSQLLTGNSKRLLVSSLRKVASDIVSKIALSNEPRSPGDQKYNNFKGIKPNVRSLSFSERGAEAAWN